MHSDELEGSPYHIIESSINVVLLQTFMWEHSNDYVDVGKDVGDVKASNWVIGPIGLDGELQFLGFKWLTLINEMDWTESVEPSFHYIVG